MKRFRGGIVFKAHRIVYHSTLGSRVIKKKMRNDLQYCKIFYLKNGTSQSQNLAVTGLSCPRSLDSARRSSQAACHMGSTVSLALWVKGGGERERQRHGERERQQVTSRYVRYHLHLCKIINQLLWAQRNLLQKCLTHTSMNPRIVW